MDENVNRLLSAMFCQIVEHFCDLKLIYSFREGRLENLQLPDVWAGDFL